MKSNVLYISLASAATIVFAGAAWFSYQHFGVPATAKQETAPKQVAASSPSAVRPENEVSVRLYQTTEQGIIEVQRSVQSDPSPVRVAETIVTEFLKLLPKGKEEPKLLGVFRDRDNIFYIDLSGAFREHAIGDTAKEYRLIRALVLSVTTNISAAQDIRILIDGKETPSLGGHISLLTPLRGLAQGGPPL
jgi:hypothetical protein